MKGFVYIWCLTLAWGLNGCLCQTLNVTRLCSGQSHSDYTGRLESAEYPLWINAEECTCTLTATDNVALGLSSINFHNKNFDHSCSPKIDVDVGAKLSSFRVCPSPTVSGAITLDLKQNEEVKIVVKNTDGRYFRTGFIYEASPASLVNIQCSVVGTFQTMEGDMVILNATTEAYTGLQGQITGNDSNTAKILAGVLVPICILLVVGAIVWYVVKYKKEKGTEAPARTLVSAVKSRFAKPQSGPSNNNKSNDTVDGVQNRAYAPTVNLSPSGGVGKMYDPSIASLAGSLASLNSQNHMAGVPALGFPRGAYGGSQDKVIPPQPGYSAPKTPTSSNRSFSMAPQEPGWTNADLVPASGGPPLRETPVREFMDSQPYPVPQGQNGQPQSPNRYSNVPSDINPPQQQPPPHIRQSPVQPHQYPDPRGQNQYASPGGQAPIYSIHDDDINYADTSGRNSPYNRAPISAAPYSNETQI